MTLRRLLIGVMAGALVLTPGFAGSSSAEVDKVAPEVRAAAEASEKITFWVHFADKAPLDSARAMQTKVEKGTEVLRVKQQTATQSQSAVRVLLDSADADYKTFWIVNAIQVTGSRKLLDSIAARPEVANIKAARTVSLPQPIREQASLPLVDAVEWGVDRVGAPRVWNELGTRGEGVVVANIDTGVQFDHPAVANQYRGKAPGGGVDHNYNWFDPSNICPTDAPCDNNDHGTHTMGTMIGNDGAANQIGVAPGAKWIAAKGCESSSCSDAALLGSGEWIVAPTDLSGQNPRPDLAPDIVNNSWGGAGFDPFYMEIVEAWIAAGIFPAFSNGNAGPSCNTSGSPGMYNISYSSGAFDIGNTIASFSSRGSGQNGEIKPNLAAPGVNVRSSIRNGAYGNFSGTSMASPHTAGAVALLWSASPALRGDIDATRTLLDGTAIDVNNTTCGGTAADNNVFGEGRLDAFTAVSNAPRGPLGALSGVISSGGAPLAGALVTATGPITRTFSTGADGAYSFPVLSVGSYTVTASKFGYTTGSGTVAVTDGGSATLDLSLTAASSATVTGTVVSGGSGVAGATVKLVGTPIQATTDAAGAFSFNAPTGSYQMTASSPLRCADSVTQALELTGDLTVENDLPDRTDVFGYSCGPTAAAYPTLTNLLTLTGDDVSQAVALPFPVPFYGQTYSGNITINTNGHADLGTTSTTQSNVAIPSTGIPNGALYPLWDDLVADATSGIYTGVVGTAPHRSFAIEWRNVRSYFDTTQRLSFVAMIGEDGSIVYRYKDVAGSSYEAGSGATIGVENATGTDAFQYSLNSAVLADGTAIGFRTTKHGVIRGTVTDANDGLAIGSAEIAVDSQSTGFTGANGGYLFQVPAGDIDVAAAKLNYETKSQAVTLPSAGVSTVNLSLRTAKVTATPGSVDVVVPTGQTRTRNVNVANAGGLATPVSVTEVGGDVPWLGASLAANNLAPGASTVLTVTVDSTGFAPGTVINAVLKISSNSGRTPDLMVPVKLVVPGFQSSLDSGSNNTHVDPSGDTWTKDLAFVAGKCGYLGSTTRITTSKAIAGTDDPARYADARQAMYEYRCDSIANGTYTVELNFAEIGGLKPNKRIFDVMIEGVEVIPNLDIALEVGAYKAYSRTFTVTVTDGVMNIRFVALVNKPIVSAVRVTHRPDLAS